MLNVCARLTDIRRADSVIEVMGLAARLSDDARAVAAAAAAGRPARARVWEQALLEAIDDTADARTAIAATHALAQLPGSAPTERLRELLLGDGWLVAHAAWALADHAPAAHLVDPLLRLVEGGRLGGMLGQQTLFLWAGDAGLTDARTPIADATEARLRESQAAPGRARLVETLGRVGGSTRRLAAIAADPAESLEVRSAAIAALGDRDGAAVPLLHRLSQQSDVLGDVAHLALFDQDLRAGKGARGGGVERIDAGIRVAQIHLGGRMDRDLTHAGQGSTGGIATLLVQLGEALAASHGVESVTTIGRGSAAEAIASLRDLATRARGAEAAAHAVIPAALGAGEDGSFAGAWPALVAAERSLNRILIARGSNLLHLRMADVGSLAAAGIARRRGLPTVFTLAPDPHALIAEMERSGELNRATFGPADGASALWFRARLVRQLADASEQVVLFPRPDLEGRLRQLLSIDITADARRYHVIPEGIDPTPASAARVQVTRSAGIAGRSGSVLGQLRTALRALGADRVGRPIVVSVGRLAEIKGMSKVAAAFAGDAALRERANLVIVGGDLDDPSAEERAELARIQAILESDPETARAVVLLGHRPHDDVLRVLAAAQEGLGPEVAPGGAYVCGSRKEEFGLAIVEALAVGLPVVAPRVGGPASYVEEGVTGHLVDTMDPAAIGAGIHGALDLATVEGRADRARELVATRFTIAAMSAALVPVYEAAVATDPVVVPESATAGEPAVAGELAVAA